MNKEETRQNMLGCLEIALFMPRGAARFSSSVEGLKKSFLLPVILLPLSIATVLAAHPAAGNLNDGSAQTLAIIYAVRLFISLGLFLGLVYFMARKMDKMEEFYRFATANNWLVLPAAALMLPLSLSFMAGNYSFSEIYPLMVFITLYSYACTAFMAAHALRIPMELACFVAIAGMAINQTSLDVLKFVASGTLMMFS
ncbi:MAG: hypothetical protein IT559_00590 [Alphaproteobacteria bacterium]|nr:hypothetical protein [Alphaproteobacteria bacterium]